MMGFYKKYLILSLYTKHRRSIVCFLYDITSGIFGEKLVVPKTDMCFPRRFDLTYGLRKKVVIYCRIRGRIQATIYDLVELNGTRLQLSLRGGVNVPLRDTEIEFTEDIYHKELIKGNPFIFAYLKSNLYQPVKTEMKFEDWPIEKIRRIATLYNVFVDVLTLVVVPGPFGAGFRKVCSPKSGLVCKGTGKTDLEEIGMHIPQLHIKVIPGKPYFQYHPLGGSILYFIPSRPIRRGARECIKIVDIYKLG
jgi:hypothetical protein